MPCCHHHFNAAWSPDEVLRPLLRHGILRERAADLAPLLADGLAHFYVCGLKAMEEGVVLALRDVAMQAGLDWEAVGAALKREGRLHLETY